MSQRRVNTKRRWLVIVAATGLVASCSSGNEAAPTATAASGSTATAAVSATTTLPATTLPPPPTTTLAPATTLATHGTVAAPNGRFAPRAATTPAGLAVQIAATDRALRDVATPEVQRPDLGQINQVAYRAWSAKPEWDAEVLTALPAELRATATAHVKARREFVAMRTTIADTVPAWEIVPPAPAGDLLRFYKEAEAATGIGWQYLAAINLVETGCGRISGLSTASAIGPMQFLQSTWNEAGIGKGDIHDPHDAIAAAARYLVRRGGPADMAKALYGYNNHTNYVRAVTAYAELFAADERAFAVVYQWEIYYFSSAGDLWLPVGYREAKAVPVNDYLAKAPWSKPA